MRINRSYLRKQIEEAIFNGVVEGEEIDETVNKVMLNIDVLIVAAEANSSEDVIAKINSILPAPQEV